MQQFTLGELWAHMGLFARLIVIVLGMMSMTSLFVLFERISAFRRSRKESHEFAVQMSGVLGKGDLVSALKVGSETQVFRKGGHLGRTITAGLTAFRLLPRATPELIVESVQRALDRQAQREIQTFKRGLGVLATVGSTAPFIGLLGTVMGIVNAFQMMAASGSGGLGTVSGGIAEALITTAFGLLVAIPAVMGFNFLQGWVDARAVDLAESSNEFLDLVSKSTAGVAIG